MNVVLLLSEMEIPFKQLVQNYHGIRQKYYIALLINFIIQMFEA